jgi:hypothetical protein
MRKVKYKIAVLGILISACLNQPAYAQHDFGLGIIVGEPTGLSGKLWLSQNSAIDGAAAWSFEGEDAFHLHMDYLLHSFNVIKVDEGKLPIYYGIGGRIKFEEEDNARVGLRIPVGLEYIFTGERVDFFLEVVPLLDLVPDTDFSLNGGIGVRYFF